MRLEDPGAYLPKPVETSYPSLSQIISEDRKLQYIYSGDVFELEADGVRYPLQSQILRAAREVIFLTPESRVIIRMKKCLLEQECDYPENNALYIMLLSGDLITYGDEGRTKQRHIATHQIFKGVLEHSSTNEADDFVYDISPLIRAYSGEYAMDTPNNLFFTTTALREYHYQKQKNNAYYHIQAINLPFQNIEFYYIDKEFSR